jgi:hypothetical protein
MDAHRPSQAILRQGNRTPLLSERNWLSVHCLAEQYILCKPRLKHVRICVSIRWWHKEFYLLCRESICLLPAFTLVSWLAYISTLKMKATCPSETSVDFQRTARRYIPEGTGLHNHGCESLRSYTDGDMIVTSSLECCYTPFSTRNVNQNRHTGDLAAHRRLLFHKVAYSRCDVISNTSPKASIWVVRQIRPHPLYNLLFTNRPVTGRYIIWVVTERTQVFGPNLERDTYYPNAGSTWFSPAPEGKFRDNTSIRPGQLPSKSLQIHHSSITLPFDSA